MKQLGFGSRLYEHCMSFFLLLPSFNGRHLMHCMRHLHMFLLRPDMHSLVMHHTFYR